MIRPLIKEINDRLQGFDKLYCLLEKKGTANNLEYSEGGQFSAIPYDEYGVGGYWRYRSKISVELLRGTSACNKTQKITFPLYFVAWFNRDANNIEPEQFAANFMDIVNAFKVNGNARVTGKVVGIEPNIQKVESGKETDTFTMLRCEVDIVVSRVCANCEIEIPEDDCSLLLTINETEIGQYTSDIFIQVVNQNDEPVGNWDGDKWVVEQGEECPTLCEQIAESTADAIVTCLEADEEKLDEVKDLICEPCPPCDPAIVTFAGYPMLTITDPCGSENDIDCDTLIELWRAVSAHEEALVQEYISKGEVGYQGITTNTVEIVWDAEGERWIIERNGIPLYRSNVGFTIDTPLEDITWVALDGQPTTPVFEQITIGTYCEPEPCPIDIRWNGIPFMTILDTCETPFIDLDCNILLIAAYAEDGGSTTGTYQPDGSEVNSRLVFILDANHRFEYNGTRWVLIRTGTDYNAAVGSELYPWLADWSATAVTVTQATIGGACDDCPACDDATVTINGGSPLSVPAGSTLDIITMGGNGDTFVPRSVDDSTPGERTLRWWIPAPMASGATTLMRNNPFGNTNRFTDSVGGQTYANGLWYAWDLTCWNESAEAYEVLELETTSTASTNWTNQTANAAAAGKRMMNRGEFNTLYDFTHVTNGTTAWPTGALTGAYWLFEQNAQNTLQAWYTAQIAVGANAVVGKTGNAPTIRVRIRQFTISGSTITFI